MCGSILSKTKWLSHGKMSLPSAPESILIKTKPLKSLAEALVVVHPDCVPVKTRYSCDCITSTEQSLSYNQQFHS